MLVIWNGFTGATAGAVRGNSAGTAPVLGLGARRRFYLRKGRAMGAVRAHNYAVSVTWTGNQGTGTSGYRAYSRDHEVFADGLTTMLGSSDPAFRGDRTRWNPELELTAALSQCHMLWYLHLCSEAGVVVLSYSDNAVGTMEETANGSGRFTEVVLRPQVTIANARMLEPAYRLHAQAHEKCFIANSVNFPVRHEPAIETENPALVQPDYRGYGRYGGYGTSE